MSAIDDVAAERKRQIEAEGWTTKHDDRIVSGDLARAAACYALYDVADEYIIDLWPFGVRCRLPRLKPKDPRRNLVRAAALIVAEIERLDRAAARTAAKAIPPVDVAGNKLR